MEEEVSVLVVMEVTLVVDREEWPEDWDMKKELTHQISVDNASEVEVVGHKIIGP